MRTNTFLVCSYIGMHLMCCYICIGGVLGLSASSNLANSLELSKHAVSIPGLSSDLFLLEANMETQTALVDRALDLDVRVEDPEADPYGVVLWPAASTVAEMVVALVQSGQVRRVFELGSGTGLVSLAALAAGADEVVASDFNALTLDILRMTADLNFAADPIRLARLSTVLFDVTDEQLPIPPFSSSTTSVEISGNEEATNPSKTKICDLLVCADMLYMPRTGRALARRCANAVRCACDSAGGQRPWRVLVGDCGRPGAEAFVLELARLKLLPHPGLAAFRPVVGTALRGLPRHSLIAAEVNDGDAPLKVGVIELFPQT